MKIEVKNVSKEFHKVAVLKNVTASFQEGKIYGLIGRNGSGKSVFLKILCGFYEPTNGTVCYDGVDIFKEKVFPPNTRAMIENPSFLPELTGYENLMLLAGIQKKIGSKEVSDILKKVHLEEDQNKKFRYYSLGMKQKLGIAQVLMEDPDVMIFDEPFNGVEDKTASQLRELLVEEKKKGKLILIATHIGQDVEQLVDEVYYFDAGVMEKRDTKKVFNES